VPHVTVQMKAQQSKGALSPQEEPDRIVPEGRLTIAHRFNGGTSGGPLLSQVPEGRLRPYPKRRFNRPSGTRGESRARFPTTEVLGYCQMSLRDKSAIYLLQIGGLHPRSSQ